jgi:DNA invertase Pin-like site-specific DNA recombinase
MANKFGYLVLAEDPSDISVQQEALTKEGCEEANIYNDFAFRVGYQSKPYTKLRKCMSLMKWGDTLVIYRLNRFGRTFLRLAKIFADLEKRGIKIEVLDPPMVFDDSSEGAARFEMLSQYVRFLETVSGNRKSDRRNHTSGRTYPSRAGRAPSLSSEKIAQIVEKRTTGNRTISSLAHEYAVARNTIYKAIKR